MITDKDIEKIIKANREFFYDKTETDLKFDEVNQKFDKLLTSVDGYAKKVDDYHQEMKMLGNKVNRNENRIEKLELKTGSESQ